MCYIYFTLLTRKAIYILVKTNIVVKLYAEQKKLLFDILHKQNFSYIPGVYKLTRNNFINKAFTLLNLQYLSNKK